MLKEIVNIGAGHSATALATLLNQKIEMEVPFVKLLSFEFGRADLTVVSIILRVEGELSGTLFVILPHLHVETLVKEVTRDFHFSLDSLSSHELGRSTIREIATSWLDPI